MYTYTMIYIHIHMHIHLHILYLYICIHMDIHADMQHESGQWTCRDAGMLMKSSVWYH
jgi:hypothetical protein